MLGYQNKLYFEILVLNLNSKHFVAWLYPDEFNIFLLLLLTVLEQRIMGIDTSLGINATLLQPPSIVKLSTLLFSFNLTLIWEAGDRDTLFCLGLEQYMSTSLFRDFPYFILE